MRNDTRTRSFLVGPFRSRVQQWHQIGVSVPLLQRGDRIVRYTGDAVSARDASTPIGYPPLHMHHIHVHHPGAGDDPPSWRQDVDHWWETHGDYARAGDDHFDYSLASPPPGCCVVMDHNEPLFVDAQLNDVRFSTGTAMAGDGGASPNLSAFVALQPSYSWFLRIGFEIEPPPTTATSSTSAATAPCTPVHKIVLGFPFDEHAQHDPLARFDAGNRETVFVWTHTLPHGGTIVTPSHSHIHRARHGGHLLVRGSHTLEGLTGNSIDALRASLPQANRIAALRSLVIDRARARGTLLCHDDENAPTFVYRPEGGDGTGGHFDRQGNFVCKPFAFGAGELVTVLLLSRPVWAWQLELFPQHAQIFLYYAAASSSHGAPPLVEMVPVDGYPNGYTLTDLDDTLEDARSLRCTQPPVTSPDAWQLTLLCHHARRRNAPTDV